MSKFITVTDALTGNKMLINTKLIATVETIKSTSRAASKITFTNSRQDEFVQESVEHLAALLCQVD